MSALPADSLTAEPLTPMSPIKRSSRWRVLATVAGCTMAALAVVAVLGASQAALAAPGHHRGAERTHGGMQPESFGASERAPQLSAFEAADRARDEYGGRVLNVRLEHGPSGPYYRVKLLDGGRVRVVHVDADH